MPHLIETLFQLPESNFPTPLKLYSAGITHPDPNYRIHREKPNLTVIEYIVSGEGHLVIDGRRYHIIAGDVYLLHPFTDQDYWSDRANPWEKIWFNLNGSLVKNLIDAYQLNDLTHFKQCPLEGEFRAALEIVRQRRPDAYTGLALALHRIFAGMNEWRQQHPETRKSPEGLKLKEFLDLNWRREVSLDELGKLISRSRSQTIRIFQRDWQTTPYQYIQDQRYRLAREYLENTDCKIAAIAELAGFKDEFYFSNWFKNKAGMSPAFYKKKFRIPV